MPEEGVEFKAGLDGPSLSFVCSVTMRFFISYKQIYSTTTLECRVHCSRNFTILNRTELLFCCMLFLYLRSENCLWLYQSLNEQTYRP